jgi:uncharacterized phage protein gp47/JayE
MPNAQIQNRDQILTRLIQRVGARTNLTDLNDNSVLLQLLDAFARELDDSNYQISKVAESFNIANAEFDALDQRAADILPDGLAREQARPAIGYLVFTRATNTGTTLLIPAGTIVVGTNGLSYRTVTQTSITAVSAEQIAGNGVGRDSGRVAALCLTPGSAGNTSAGNVTRFTSRPTGVTEVTNVTAFIGGRDRELDSAFRSRIKTYALGRDAGTKQKIIAALTGLADPNSGARIASVSVVDNPSTPGYINVYIDDGFGTAAANVVTFSSELVVSAGPTSGLEFAQLANWPVNIESGITLTSSTRGVLARADGVAPSPQYWLNPGTGLVYFNPPIAAGETVTGSYSVFGGLVQRAQRVLEGDPAQPIDFPGVIAAGTVCRVLSPNIIPLTINMTLRYDSNANIGTVTTAVENALLEFINGLVIGQGVARNDIIRTIMNVDGIADVDLQLPATNVNIQQDELIRIDANDIDFL